MPKTAAKQSNVRVLCLERGKSTREHSVDIGDRDVMSMNSQRTAIVFSLAQPNALPLSRR